MNKKALLPGQVLIFILAGLIFVLILGFGYTAINDLLKSSSDISIAEVKADFDSAVDSSKRSFGSVRKIDLRVPKGVVELCFFDYGKCANDNVDTVSDSGKHISWALRACSLGSANVFSVPRLIELSVPSIRITEGEVGSAGKSFICIKEEGGVVVVKLTGKGDSVEVGKWVFEE